MLINYQDSISKISLVNRKPEGGQYLWKGSDNTILGMVTTVQVPVKEGRNTIYYR